MLVRDFFKRHVAAFFEVSVLKEVRILSGPPEQGGQRGRQPPPPSKSSLLMSPLNVLFLKKVTQNVHENQQLKSRAS